MVGDYLRESAAPDLCVISPLAGTLTRHFVFTCHQSFVSDDSVHYEFSVLYRVLLLY